MISSAVSDKHSNSRITSPTFHNRLGADLVKEISGADLSLHWPK